MDTYKLIRVLPNGTELQIVPSLETDSLIAAGNELMGDHPGFDLRVVLLRGKRLWQSKGTPGQRSATQQEND